MDPTPNTNGYMLGGFIFFTVTMLIYIWSLISRWKALKLEEKMLDELETK